MPGYGCLVDTKGYELVMARKIRQDVLDKSSGGKEEKALCALQLNGSDRDDHGGVRKLFGRPSVSSEHYTCHSHVSL